jgi:hypothetical protein
MQAVMQSCSKPTAYSSLYALCLLLYVATELLWLLWLLTYYDLLTIWLGLHAVLDEALHVVLEANRLEHLVRVRIRVRVRVRVRVRGRVRVRVRVRVTARGPQGPLP